MAVEVRVDGRLQKRAVIPLCHLRRAAIEQRQYRATVDFRFRGGRTFKDEYTTKPSETIEGGIWQAGADPTAIILGVSFSGSATGQVLLNTLYVLVPGRRDSATLDRGITVVSYPVSALAHK
jgi:hypothetical protein